MRFFYYTFLFLFSLGIIAALAAGGAIAYAISYYGRDLPDTAMLKDYDPAVLTRLYAGDGRLLTQYAEEERVFMPIETIPDMVKHAFIAAEDQNFYQHSGIDPVAIVNAAIGNLASGGRPRGASTITQQVAKNFFLTNEVSYERKIKEAILAFRMEKSMTKDRLLELYLNEIYLGERSYGVAAAALNYFNKPLENLTIDEAAFLAALPKAPNNYHPLRKHDAALARRNWVIGRMLEDDYITASQADLAKLAPLTMVQSERNREIHAAYFAEEVRRQLAEEFGSKSLYGGGLVVRTTVNPELQEIAVKTLRTGLMAYDKRRGWRGPIAHFDSLDGWQDKLSKIPLQEGMISGWSMAVILSKDSENINLGFADGRKGIVPVKTTEWTGPNTKPLKGDVVVVEDDGNPDTKDTYTLHQIPKVNGALVAMDPHTGRVLAMQGGWKYEGSEFNRATQAQRQPGSAFKPFVYLSALEHEFTPATLVLDAPFVIDQGPGMPKWRPVNYSGEYYGPTTIRVGLEKSRNLMTVRLADHVGIQSVIDVAKRFGVVDDMPPMLSYSLGAGETTLLKMTTAYAQFVNGGKKITPTLIDRIQDRRGKTVARHDSRPCEGCGPLIEWSDGLTVPTVPDTREQLADPRHAYQMVSMLEGVVQRGTAMRIKELNRPLAGKTGTTNDSKDVWFVGFSPDLVVGVFVGFDEPRTLGKKETGASIAVPIFKDFMQMALADTPAMPFRVPPGIKQVRINAESGTRARGGEKNVIWEAFLSGTEPTGTSYILDGSGISAMPSMGYGGGYGGGYSAASDDSGASYDDDGAAFVPGIAPSTGQSGNNGASAVTGTGGLY